MSNSNDTSFEQNFMPGLAVDTVIFGFHEHSLRVLVLRYKRTDIYALPGGFIQKKESLDDAAKRVLKERTGLKNIYLQQFYAFGDLARFDNAPMKKILQGNALKVSEAQWLLQRFISVSYYALIDYTKAVPIPDTLSESCEWYDLKKMPKMMMDHNLIVTKALATLRENLDRKLIAFKLLPQTFTMNELQVLYETILGEKLLRTSFHRKMQNLGILEHVDRKVTGGAHKAPYLYRFVAGRKQGRK